MVEVHFITDLLPEVDKTEYTAWVKRAIDKIAIQPGLLEFKALRNVLGSPLIRVCMSWEKMEDWKNYHMSDEWRRLEAEVRAYIVDVKMEIWESSPLTGEPLRL